jgi:hypothetical protein
LALPEFMCNLLVDEQTWKTKRAPKAKPSALFKRPKRKRLS